MSTLRPELAARWGLPADVKIAGGDGDKAASAVGMGLVASGQGFVSLDASGVIFVCTPGFAPNPARAAHAFCHALPNSWHQMSVTLSASSAIDWATRTFGFSDVAGLFGAAASLDGYARAHAPLFLPYLSGERSPHNNAHAQGVLFGLTQAHSRADIAYAVAEGVGYGLRDGLMTLMRPDPATPLALVGGGARSAWWSQLLADVLQTPLVLGAGGESGGALGAARLGWLSDGGSLADVCTQPQARQLFAPDVSTAEVHGPRFARFQAIYAGLRPLFPVN